MPPDPGRTGMVRVTLEFGDSALGTEVLTRAPHLAASAVMNQLLSEGRLVPGDLRIKAEVVEVAGALDGPSVMDYMNLSGAIRPYRGKKR